jgi:hypothetical protein
MPDNPPPAYWWTVSLSDGQRLLIEAAYPVIDDGHMLLKNSDHKIVFAAAPGSGCSFNRGGRADADPAADNPPPGTGFWPCGCPVEGAKAKAQAASGNCPHGFPPTVRCHECSPVTAPAGEGTRL